MCLNRTRLRRTERSWAAVSAGIMLSLFFALSAWAAPFKIALLPGDSHTVTSLQAAKTLAKEMSGNAAMSGMKAL